MDSISSPKEKIRANIYKELLIQEKRKNKNKTLYSLSLFFLGIAASSTYQVMINKTNAIYPQYVIDKEKVNENNKDLFMQHFFESDLFNERKIELNADTLFGLEKQI